MTGRVDALALAAAATAAATTWAYVAVVHSQGNDPAGWVLVALVAGALGAGYASRRTAPGRLTVLGVSSVLLGLLGLAAILSIGLLVLLAGGLCLLSLVRSLSARPATTVPGQ